MPAVHAHDETPLEDGEPRYERGPLLGRGGMGEVFLCTDQRIGRQVAMKQIREGADHNPAARRRFLREARVQGQLEHPAIVPVYEVARASDGRTYFTMKRIKGESLREVLVRMREGTTREGDSRRRLLNAFAQVCLAVDFAHERGVLHRDLKPANIMLGDYGEVYVLDWGLAKIADAPELENLTLPRVDGSETHAGEVLGTPGYIAPEQLEQGTTRQSDVYSLGCVLFEILTLERLHPSASTAELIASTLDGADASVTKRFPNLNVPPELEELCIQATATSPADRTFCARTLHDALTGFLDGDRDLELRKAAADEQATRATELSKQALCGDEQARVQALHSVGRALGLDPNNRSAIGTMVELLESPPATIPAEVAAQVESRHQEHLRLAARDGAMGYASWLLYVPLVIMMGVRDALSLGISTGLMVLAAGVSYWVARRDHYVRGYSVLVMVLGTLALASMTRLFGPYVLLPTILMGQAVAFSLSPYPRERYLAAALAVAGVVGPIVLEAIGWIPSQTRFTDHGMEVVAGVTSLSPTLTPIVLAVASVALIVTPMLLIGRARDAWSAAQYDHAVRAWSLRQLVGSEDPQ